MLKFCWIVNNAKCLFRLQYLIRGTVLPLKLNRRRFDVCIIQLGKFSSNWTLYQV